MKFKVRGTPDEINTLYVALGNSGMADSIDLSEIYKADPGHKTGWAWVTVWFSEVMKSNAPITIHQRRLRRAKGDKRPTAGYVYLLKAIDGSYKIGKTVNPKSRKRTFDVRLPFQVEYIHTILTDDMGKLEKALHKKFEGKRLRGSEFFALDAQDVEFIKLLGERFDSAKCANW